MLRRACLSVSSDDVALRPRDRDCMRPIRLALALLGVAATGAVASPPFPIATGGACSDTAYYETVLYARSVITVCMHNPPVEDAS